MTPPAALIFDMDGVIIDSYALHVESWAVFFAHHRISVEIGEFMARSFGASNREILGPFFPDRAGDPGFLREQGEIKEVAYRRLLRERRPEPLAGLREYLGAARAAGVRLAVGSSAPRGNVEATLEVLALEEFFPVWTCSDDVARGKPAPDIFLRCCELLGAAPAEALVFEDSFMGLEAARLAGCGAVGVATTHTGAELAGRCTFWVEDFTDPRLRKLLSG